FATWIADGRVRPESYLWREGWPEWRRAGDVAPELPAPLAPPAQEAVIPPVLNTKAPEPRSAATRYAEKRRHWMRLRLLAAAALLLLTVTLGGVLAWILMQDPNAAEVDPLAGVAEAMEEDAGEEANGAENQPDGDNSAEEDARMEAEPGNMSAEP
ncbi:MAG: GYF domain-containing protein, partial [Planctomycetota bacterium]